MLFFDDPSVKEFMIHVVKHAIGILDSWINKHYNLEKAVICPSCKRKIEVNRENLVNSHKI